MIETKFIVKSVTGDYDDAHVVVVCKDCKHEFDVLMNILRPKNCRYVLDKSITVTCPQCGAEATTTTNESEISTLEETANKLQTHIDEHCKPSKLPFFVKIANIKDTQMNVECRKCGYEFAVDVAAGKNATRSAAGFTVTCPLCANYDENTREKAVARMEIVAVMLRLCTLRKQITELKKGAADGESAIQTPVH